MWEKNSTRLGTKLILVLLILLLCVGFFVGYQYVSTQTASQDAELLTMHTQQLEEQAVAKLASLDDLNAFYQTDLDAIAKYLPGIVCWGDSLTTGSAGGVSYPDTLQTLIDAAIVDKYDFRSTVEAAESYTRADWSIYSVDIPVVNMGAGKESTDTILGRNGAVPFVTKKDFVIPAGCEPVQVEIISSNGGEVSPLTQGDNGINNVFINGIEGKLSLDLESYKSYHSKKYFFTRDSSGGEVTVAAGTEIRTAASSLYKDYIPVIFTGTYDNTLYGITAEELIAKQKQLIAHQTGNSDRYIILGLYYMNERPDHGYYGELEKYEAAMLQEYGDHFINVRKYLCSDGLADAGITATEDDAYDVSHGHVPKSLRSAADESELNAKGYKLLGQLVYDRMNKLGYFDEVKDELGITALEKLEKQEATKSDAAINYYY